VSDRPKLVDVARLSGVSLAAASYVLNGQEGRVGEERRQRVLEAAEALGYRRNPAAMTLHRGHANVVMIVVSASSFREARQLPLAEITLAISRLGYAVVTHVDAGDDSVLLDSVQELQPCAVVLLMPLGDGPRQRLGALVPTPLLEWQSRFRPPGSSFAGLEEVAGAWFSDAVSGATVGPLFDAWLETACAGGRSVAPGMFENRGQRHE
jgi:DNA-binding LacI/PurR family transcriptional regulator